mmetsp:Transcript_32266/g.50037  ORF Transcript_32266/g.50037 Transcript_32266/m.50037 type:complete len:126 (+) Transcript_32266:85-462(+)|eukprot:CAMPEP_0117048246 /NCGR_PEP_ID=MMETSP0472-20121206/33342_1 /TAXON_ID=693140 ORGANISM="Tiarina fusus, Strain LIS" /NCGR_SAMPLE_ID=MMETSP0472 /ASSEMBLY_ACC=CAM_ASM_000603 /LENGTH=125 /DNA_ID=CAMNT_0004761255 /DNA_START=85 /DNA_END=462 /DNA_ORIENTATION=+
MKLSLALLLPLAVNAFQAPAHPTTFFTSTTELHAKAKSKNNPMASILRNLANNFEPLHGHGSLEKDLDEQWEAQQELLKNRRAKNIDKEHLKQKYKNPENVKFDLQVGLNTKSAAAAKKKRPFSP